MTATKRRKAHILSNFKDAGTGESFKAGSRPMIEEGVFANYEAARLVEAAPVTTKAATPKARPKTAAAPATKPAPPAGATGPVT